MIGLSLSFCLKDIASGKVHKDEVSKIISGTMAENEEDFQEIFDQYMESYWRSFDREYMKELFEWAVTIMDQPRVRGEEPPLIADGHWLIE